MSSPLSVRPEAAEEIERTYAWYEERRAGLGDEFMGCLTATMDTISRSPERYAVVHRDVRRALVRRFPHAVHYAIRGDVVVVLAVFHASRDPSDPRFSG